LFTVGATSTTATMQTNAGKPGEGRVKVLARAGSVTVQITGPDRAAGTITGFYNGSMEDFGYGRCSGGFTAPVEIAAPGS